ncbi:MAG: hypothetical protein Q9228_007209 [Teloschistes exilis]
MSCLLDGHRVDWTSGSFVMSRFLKRLLGHHGRPHDTEPPLTTEIKGSPGLGSGSVSHDVVRQIPANGLDRFSQVHFLNETTVAKSSDLVSFTEAATMRFVRSKTSIPVPAVLDVFVQPETQHVCILMEYIKGRPLNEVWDTFNDTQKEHVVAQLRGFMEELRQIKGTTIGPVDGTYCVDQFFDGEDKETYGPYKSEAAFNNGLIRAIGARGCNTWTELVTRLILSLPEHSIVFTHNDLAPRNIIVRDGNVVAILDWECSGFYPEYWEYVKALYWPDQQSGWHKENVVDRILQPYLLEYAYLLHARDLIS